MIIFVIGSGIVFAVIGGICAFTGKLFVGNPYFTLIVASIILIMGLKILDVIDFELPVIIKEIPQNNFNNEICEKILTTHKNSDMLRHKFRKETFEGEVKQIYGLTANPGRWKPGRCRI